MAIQINDNLNTLSPKILDDRYGPWTGVTQANTSILEAFRVVGLTVGIITGTTTFDGGRYIIADTGIEEYWYYTGITDSDLVVKTSGTGGITSISVSANTGLGIINDNTLFTTYNPAGLSPTLETPYTVGGIPAGTTVTQLSGDTLVSLFTDLLFPTVQPTYTIPTITIGGVTDTLAEVGSTISLSLTATGIKNDAGQYTQLRLLRDTSTVLITDTSLISGATTNLGDQFGFPEDNNPNASYPTSYSESYLLPAPAGVATSTTTTYNSDGNYDSGLALRDSKGVYDVRTPQVRSVNAPQLSADTFSSSVRTYTNIYPYFWGVSSTVPTASGIASIISGGTANKVIGSASGTISIIFSATVKYLWVAVYTYYPTKTQWFIRDDNKGTIGPSSLFALPVTQQVDSPDGYWADLDFKMYITNYQTTVSTAVSLLN